MSDWLQELLETPPAPDAPREDRPDVTASDVAGYTFCGRSWWLRRETGPPAEALPALEDGERRHAAAGQAVEEATRVLRRTVVWAPVGSVVAVALLTAGGR